MFTLASKREKTGLEKTIEDQIEALKAYPPDSEEYAKIVNQLVKVHALKEEESPKRLNPDVLVTVAANLAVAVTIVSFERNNVVTSKVLDFLKKMR